MRVHICAVGRLRAGPERELMQDYLTRFDRTGRPLGLGPVLQIEVEDKKNMGMAAEGALLERAIPSGALMVVMDERGQTLSSPEFASALAKWRDDGRQDLACGRRRRLDRAGQRRAVAGPFHQRNREGAGGDDIRHRAAIDRAQQCR